MITDRKELDQQLRKSKLQSRLVRDEFERLLQLANQRKVLVQKEEINESSVIQQVIIWRIVPNCLVMIMSIPCCQR